MHIINRVWHYQKKTKKLEEEEAYRRKIREEEEYRLEVTKRHEKEVIKKPGWSKWWLWLFIFLLIPAAVTSMSGHQSEQAKQTQKRNSPGLWPASNSHFGVLLRSLGRILPDYDRTELR